MLVVHQGGCPWPKKDCICLETYGRYAKLVKDEPNLTPEQLVEKWNELDPEHKWGVIKGQVVKTDWPNKGYRWELIDGEIVRVKDDE